MEKEVAVFAMINFLVMGFSHLIQPEVWKEFFSMLHSKGRAGAFANGFLSMAMGSIIVSFHNVWSGPAIILTLIGWAFISKTLVIFLFPKWDVDLMASVQTAGPLKFRIAGFGMIGIALLVGVSVLQGSYD